MIFEHNAIIDFLIDRHTAIIDFLIDRHTAIIDFFEHNAITRCYLIIIDV